MTSPDSESPPRLDHDAIGSARVPALVARDTRFEDSFPTHVACLPDANVLRTTLTAPGGSFEDVDPSSGALLSSFSQASAHVSPIHATITIGEILDAREGHFRAWT